MNSKKPEKKSFSLFKQLFVIHMQMSLEQ